MAEIMHNDLEEALRLAEVGEFLYNECAYAYGDGYSEPREYGIEWQWVQSKPDEYGQGQLLAASTRWQSEQAEDGITTEATKLRAALASHTSALAERDAEIAARDALLRECYSMLAFAFNRIHGSSRTRDTELARDFAKTRGKIEKLLGRGLHRAALTDQQKG